MLFNSLEFVVFLCVVLVGHFVLIPRAYPDARKRLLLCASYIFYMSWSPPFGLLLLFSTVLDFVLAKQIETTPSPTRRRTLLATSLVANLGLLGFFKYGDFLTRGFYDLLGPVFGGRPPVALDIVLPVGISFYTFQTISYTIDVYRGHQPVCRRFLDFALYVSFFPQLVAGPIVRSHTFLPQLQRSPKVGSGDVEKGLVRIASGLLKKVVLADTLGACVDAVFGAPTVYTGLDTLLAVYAYTYQIYFDFSGYSDIAIGVARLLGYRIPENFDRPYLAASPREFWRRWHISLSTWLRDYLYIGLGGNRGSRLRTTVNLMITMLLGGLWHGAGWHFVVWGAAHGLLLLGHRALIAWRPSTQSRLPVTLRRIVTFHLVAAAWVLFRSPDLATAGVIYRGLLSWHFVPSLAYVPVIGILLVVAALHVIASPAALRRTFLAQPGWVQGTAYAGITVLVFLFSPATSRFIYFQF